MKNSLRLFFISINVFLHNDELYNVESICTEFSMQFKYSISYQKCLEKTVKCRTEWNIHFLNCQSVVKHSNHYFHMHTFRWQSFTVCDICRTIFFFRPRIYLIKRNVFIFAAIVSAWMPAQRTMYVCTKCFFF